MQHTRYWVLTIQEQSSKTSAIRLLTILDRKHDKWKCKSSPLGHNKGGHKNTYTSTYTRVVRTHHFRFWSGHICPICSSKISFTYAILMKFDRQIERLMHLSLPTSIFFCWSQHFSSISEKVFKTRLFDKNTVTFEWKTQISLSSPRMKLSIEIR